MRWRWKAGAAMRRWLHVDGVVGGDEAFAEEDLEADDGALADEGGGLVDEDLVDEVGVVDEDDGGAEEAVVGDAARRPCGGARRGGWAGRS